MGYTPNPFGNAGGDVAGTYAIASLTDGKYTVKKSSKKLNDLLVIVPGCSLVYKIIQIDVNWGYTEVYSWNCETDSWDKIE